MILKGNQRAGGDDLASHLMNLYDNDAMQLAEVRGTIAQDLHGAFAEFEALASGTRCKQSLYSLSINPSEPMTRAQYAQAVERIEGKLGLAGQPRAIVFHVKEGREHCHVVWSRIDVKNMRAVQLSHDRQKLRSVSQKLAQEFGHKLPDGLATDRGTVRYEFNGQAFDTAELAQGARSGLKADGRRAEITEAYRQSDSGAAFADALWERGYYLARGDKRGFVVLDRAGQVHSLSRQVTGAKAKDVRGKLAPLEPEHLPSVKDMRAQIAAEIDEDLLDDERVPHMKRTLKELHQRQQQRRAAMTAEAQALELAQRQERMALHSAQKREAEKPFARAASAVRALFGKVPVLRTVLAPLYRNPRLNLDERHRLEREALERRYSRERRNMDRRVNAIDRVETRENKSFARDQRRVEKYRELQKARRQAEALGLMKENAKHITARPDKGDGEKKVAGKKTTPRRPKGYGLRRE